MGLLLGLTLLGGFGFMGIKAIEYHHKWEKHLFPGTMNKFNRAFVGDGTGDTGTSSADKAVTAPTAAPTPAGLPGGATPGETLPPSASAGTVEALDHARTEAAHVAAVPMIRPLVTDPHAGSGDAARIVPVSGGPAGLAGEYHGTAHGHLEFGQLAERDQLRVNTFFSIYFLMTGLHGLHVVVGMGLIAWIMIKGFGGAFGPSYYTPVDLVGLYWHLVDLIWIFLFPLLYLIH
jgi:hypothetical protein